MEGGDPRITALGKLKISNHPYRANPWRKSEWDNYDQVPRRLGNQMPITGKSCLKTHSGLRNCYLPGKSMDDFIVLGPQIMCTFAVMFFHAHFCTVST